MSDNDPTENLTIMAKRFEKITLNNKNLAKVIL
jgi:hypothetical protein